MTHFTTEVEGCCKAAIICSFEAGHVGDKSLLNDQLQDRIYNDVRRNIIDIKLGKEWDGDNYPEPDYIPAVILATTTNVQVNANKVLPLLGFKKANDRGAVVKGTKTHRIFVWTLSTGPWKEKKYPERQLKKINTPF